jgi:hypothetical protein
VSGADRTRRHPTSRPPGHRVPNLCDHPRSFTPGLLLLPRSSSLHAMPHLPPAHHETSKHDSPNKTKKKEKQNKTISDLNSNLAKSMTHHNQTKELTTWFLNLPLDESIDNKITKFKVRIQDPRSTARRPKKLRKAQEDHLEDGRPQKLPNRERNEMLSVYLSNYIHPHSKTCQISVNPHKETVTG